MSQSPRMPEIGEFVRGTGRLFAVEVVPPPPQPPPRKEYIFEEITGRAELRLRGKVIRVLGTYNDFYGRASGVEAATRAAQNAALVNELRPGSDTEAVAVKIVSYYRAKPSNEVSFYAREFLNFQRLDWGDQGNVPETAETVVWSSAWIPEEVSGD